MIGYRQLPRRTEENGQPDRCHKRASDGDVGASDRASSICAEQKKWRLVRSRTATKYMGKGWRGQGTR